MHAANQGPPPGDDFFIDSVHPNVAGHRLIATIIFETLVKDHLVPDVAPPESELEPAMDAYGESLNVVYLYENYLYLAQEQELLGRPKKAIKLLQDALGYVPNGRIATQSLSRLHAQYDNIDTSE